MKKIICVLFLLPVAGAWCQSVRGKVQDGDGKPLPFVNVLLLSPQDSSLVKGILSDSLGMYAIEDVRSGTYLLSASMIGYRAAYSSPLTIGNGESGAHEVVLTLPEDSQQLKEVVITEKRPFVEQYIDRMVVNVANSIIASGSTALEVLEKAPGVTVDRQNGMLQLRGKDGVIVQMDGKQTYLSTEELVNLLSTLPSDNIDQIELITNPSSKYDAAGNSGIINIRMKKNNSVGTNGSATLAAGTGRFYRTRGSLQMNHRTQKVNVFGNYSANKGGNYFDLETFQTLDEGEQHNIADKKTYITFDNWGQNAKAGMDYTVNKNTTIGVVWSGFWTDNGETGTAESAFQRETDGPVYLYALTDKTISSVSSNQIGNINFQHTFGAKGGQLTADVDVGRFTRDFVNTLLTETVSEDEGAWPLMGLAIQMPTLINIRTAKVDYNRSLSPNWKMEAGAKSSYVFSDNDMTLQQGEAGNLEPDPELSNHFQYTERVHAAYASFSGKLANDVSIQVGLRTEHTHSEGNSLTLNNKVTRDYINLFPTLFVSKPVSNEHSLTFSYSYRIDRPNYQFLNPARSYVDPYVFSQGNAYLNPQYTHSIEFKHGYKDKVFTSLGASFVSDLVYYMIQPVDSIRTERTPLNIGRSESYNLTVTFPVVVMKGWNLQINLLGLYSQFHYNFKGQAITAEQVSGRINAANTFVFGKGWTGEATGWLRTPSVYATSRSPWMGTIDLGLQKSLNAQWQVKLSFQDVFHTNKFVGTITLPDFRSDYQVMFDTKVVMLNATYSFGNQQLKRSRQRSTGSEEEMQRTN